MAKILKPRTIVKSPGFSKKETGLTAWVRSTPYDIQPVGDDYGFFNFVLTNVRKNTHFSPDISVEENIATLVVPEQYLELHRDNKIYVINTDYDVGDFLCTGGEPSKAYSRITSHALKRNPYLATPFLVLSKDAASIIMSNPINLLVDNKYGIIQNNSLESVVREDVPVVSQILDGEHPVMKLQEFGDQKVHLIVNTAGIDNALLLTTLARDSGYNLKRYNLKKK